MRRMREDQLDGHERELNEGFRPRATDGMMIDRVDDATDCRCRSPEANPRPALSRLTPKTTISLSPGTKVRGSIDASDLAAETGRYRTG